MNAPNRPADVISAPKPAPAPFASVRSSKDLTLAAFAGALLVAFALQAGAFLPRLSASQSTAAAASSPTPSAAAPAVVARRPPVVRGAPAATPELCASPRG